MIKIKVNLAKGQVDIFDNGESEVRPGSIASHVWGTHL